MKFNVGDKVKILDGSKISDYACFWATGMEVYIGDIDTFEYKEVDE